MTNIKEKQLNLEFELFVYLEDIKEYIHNTILYLKDPMCGLDKDELIMYLSSVDQTIDDVSRVLNKYIKKAWRNENGQLQ